MTTGLPFSEGLSSVSTATKKASMSTCRMCAPVSSAPGGEYSLPEPSCLLTLLFFQPEPQCHHPGRCLVEPSLGQCAALGRLSNALHHRDVLLRSGSCDEENEVGARAERGDGVIVHIGVRRLARAGEHADVVGHGDAVEAHRVAKNAVPLG